MWATTFPILLAIEKDAKLGLETHTSLIKVILRRNERREEMRGDNIRKEEMNDREEMREG